MMNKGKKVRKDMGIMIRTVAFLLMGIQIVLGLLWACCNLTEIPLFIETKELEEISKTFLFDSYSGVVYPILIWVASLFERFLTIKYCVVVYVVQIAVAFAAYQDFQKKVLKIESRQKRSFFSLFVMTVPTVLQCHMAVVPYSLVSSCFVWMLSCIIYMWREKEASAGSLLCVCGGWLLCAALIPDYAWIGGVTAVAGFVAYMVQHRRFAVKLVLALVFTTLSLGAFSNMLLRDNPNKIQRSVGAAMVSRCVWPYFLDFSFFWSYRIGELWDSNGLVGLSVLPEKVIYEFGPTMDRTYGKELANYVYWDSVRVALETATKDIVEEMGTDFLAYSAPTAAMYFQLEGKGCSYTGWNYGRMTDYTPRLTRTYVTISLQGWFVIGILSVVYWALCGKKPKKDKCVGTGKRWQIGLLTGTGLLINVWYVMSKGHMPDYKYVIVISILWAMAFADGLSREMNCEE